MAGKESQVDSIFVKASELFTALPFGIAVLDANTRILDVNPRFLELVELPEEKVIGRNIRALFEDWRSTKGSREKWEAGIAKIAAARAQEGQSASFMISEPPNQGRTFRLTFRHATFLGESRLLLTLEEETETHKREQKIKLMQMLAKHIRGTPDLKKLLFTILTCVTAGRALSFSRAFIFLPTRGGKHLKCKMAVGPGSQHEAWNIWSRLAKEDPDLDTMITRYSAKRVQEEAKRAFNHLLKYSIPVNSQKSLVAMAFKSGLPMWTRDAWNDERESMDFVSLYKATEFVAIPMIAAGKSLGVITADNLYLNKAIVPSDIEFLSILAGQAALALENAFAQATLRAQVKHLAKVNKNLYETRSKLILSEKMAAVGSVATKITHEIRNPLTTIGGFARRILKFAEPGTKIHRNAGIIVEEVIRLEKLLQGILDYSRPSNPTPRLIDPGEIVKEVLYTFCGRPETQSARINVINNVEVAKAFADPDHVRQILINLLKNAFEASGKEGEITVMVAQERDMVVFSVKDNGPGMTKEVKKRLFEPFFTTKIAGTGLGLPITKTLVAANKGRIHVESQPGKGSTFKVFLPTKEKWEGGGQTERMVAQ